jgi:hypothetical protein
MITKIKNLVKKLTLVEWVVLGVAVLALVVGLSKCGGHNKKGHHGGNKHGGEAVVEVAPAAK